MPKSNRAAIRDVMYRLKPYWERGDWLSPRNPYRKDSVGQIDKDSKNGGRFNHIRLAEYVTASTIVHCFDGWSYLARALEAEMAGDPDAARHLGYYAELRAAMSVLASEGIGVFNDTHILVTKPDQCIALKDVGSTHDFAWHALEAWAEFNSSNETVFKSIKPGGLPLSDWLNQFPAGSSFVAKKWLLQWGLDLSRFSKDKKARNVSSYRPTTFVSSGPRLIRATMESILQFWEICEPGPRGGFPILDRHLLRSSLFLISKSHAIDVREKIHEQGLGSALGGLSPVDKPVEGWIEFLSYKNLSERHQVLIDVNGNSEPNHLDHSKQVLARAALLLRIATGCSTDLLEETGSDFQEDLEFWQLTPLVRRRLWAESEPIPEPTDLWLDVEEASNSIARWFEQDNFSDCHYALWTERPSAASTLSTAERAFLWGVGF